MRIAVGLEPEYEAEIVTGVGLVTLVVIMLKLPLELPALIVIDGGTETTEGMLFERVTTAPPLGAGLPSVTIPCAWNPPAIVTGER